MTIMWAHSICQIFYARDNKALADAKASKSGRHSTLQLRHEHKARGPGQKSRIVFRDDIVKISKPPACLTYLNI
jgi:hypothetical protein